MQRAAYLKVHTHTSPSQPQPLLPSKILYAKATAATEPSRSFGGLRCAGGQWGHHLRMQTPYVSTGRASDMRSARARARAAAGGRRHLQAALFSRSIDCQNLTGKRKVAAGPEARAAGGMRERRDARAAAVELAASEVAGGGPTLPTWATSDSVGGTPHPPHPVRCGSRMSRTVRASNRRHWSLRVPRARGVPSGVPVRGRGSHPPPPAVGCRIQRGVTAHSVTSNYRLRIKSLRPRVARSHRPGQAPLGI